MFGEPPDTPRSAFALRALLRLVSLSFVSSASAATVQYKDCGQCEDQGCSGLGDGCQIADSFAVEFIILFAIADAPPDSCGMKKCEIAGNPDCAGVRRCFG